MEIRPPVYFDAARNQKDRSSYYAGVSVQDELFGQLNDLVTRTHEHKTGYNPSDRLFPWVDLRPSLRLDSLYAAGESSPEVAPRMTSSADVVGVSEMSRRQLKRLPEEVRAEYLADLERQCHDWARVVAESGLDALAMATRLAQLETQSYFNCEHVVPRKWMPEQGPMVGDLHHLFTCESEANRVRGSRRFGEGESEEIYEPAGGKGAIARATLYFLLRYPGQVGNQEGEYTTEDLKLLLRWHQQYPVSLYEMHRNQAIADIQGNRNPLIDFPEWAQDIDFTRGLGKVHRFYPASKSD